MGVGVGVGVGAGVVGIGVTVRGVLVPPAPIAVSVYVSLVPQVYETGLIFPVADAPTFDSEPSDAFTLIVVALVVVYPMSKVVWTVPVAQTG